MTIEYIIFDLLDNLYLKAYGDSWQDIAFSCYLAEACGFKTVEDAEKTIEQFDLIKFGVFEIKKIYR